ncbi:hypothetical protein G6O69_33860 [Pseudenhygromyxa sp. WMMC2535]|uniref:hypothetical protein n=1 Tax=Pseudenhygromyxa sp. WMMC2535 TaxID=2712867 RepID=UPI00155414B8|nr:hypothetical protein [Pseudenhygromyxa sp. WMMC2535]NVB42856.1 hypothetical protein [Pseudenhygromyxa sp. WMMC2535]
MSAEAPATEQSASAGGRARLLAKVSLGLALVLLPVAARALVEGRVELARADAARDVGDLDAELRHLGRAARWAAPIFDHDERARARLRERAEQAEDAGDDAEALAAWRELRRALLSVRGPLGPDAESLALANEGILAALGERAGPRFDRARAEAELAALPGPEPVRSHLAVACMLGWIVATLGFFFRGLDGQGRLIPGPASRWGVGAVGLLIAWIALM